MKIGSEISKRSFFVLAVFVGLWLLLCAVLFNIQINSYDEYQGHVIDQITKETTVTAKRGDIYDTNMNLLAGSKSVYLVFISPQDIINSMSGGFSIFASADDMPGLKYPGLFGDVQRSTHYYTYTDADGVTSSYAMDRLIAKGLSEILGVDYSKIMELTGKKGRYYEVIKKNVEKQDADRVREFIDEYGLEEQIYLTASTKRYYPNDSLACHVIGFVNADGDGVYGLESYYNDVLKGSTAKYLTARDGHGNDLPTDYESYLDEQDGYSIISTIDQYLQYRLEEVLYETLTENKADNRAAGICIDVNTGEVLAMATVGGYDLNDPYTLTDYYQQKLIKSGLSEGTDEYTSLQSDLRYMMWNNKAVTELYEPGSTFKIITSAMGLELGAVNLNDTFTCNGSIVIDGYSKPIKCHKLGGHGTLVFPNALQQSCNPAFVTIGLRIGRENFYKYFHQFGYGSRVGIDLPGEAVTYYHSYKDFSNVSLAVYAFGQTFKVTPIQHITAIAAVANGGYLVKPHVLKQIIDSDGNVIDTYDTNVVRQVISSETSKTLCGILEENVSGNGGAKNAYVAGYKVAAKTGTSQKRDKYDENGEDTLRVSSCVGFAPADDPQIAVLILVDEPKAGVEYGSVVAAPYVSKFLTSALPYLGFEPQYSDEEKAAVESVVGRYVGYSTESMKTKLESEGYKYVVVGNGDTVTGQMPAGGTVVSNLAKVVILYTNGEEPKNDVVVPNVVGKTAEAANRLIINANLNIRIEGAANFTSGDGATVVEQSPMAGETVPEGTVITLTFRHLSNITD